MGSGTAPVGWGTVNPPTEAGTSTAIPFTVFVPVVAVGTEPLASRAAT